MSAEQEMIVAMQAKFDSIKDTRLKLDTGEKKKKKKQKVLKKKNAGENDRDYAWKNTNAENKGTVMKFGKKYYWCVHHNQGQGMWVLHKPDNCNNKATDETTESESATTDNAMANRAVAEMEASDSDEDSE